LLAIAVNPAVVLLLRLKRNYYGARLTYILLLVRVFLLVFNSM